MTFGAVNFDYRAGRFHSKVDGLVGKIMDELFDTTLCETKKVEHVGTGQTCGKCEFAIRPHYYRKDWIYCEITKSKKTQFGILKVKSRQPACERFSNDKVSRERSE